MLTRMQESPHEHQQSQLLSRIIVNVVSAGLSAPVDSTAVS